MRWSRRGVLGGGAALMLGPAVRASAQPRFASAAIDVHHHFLPPFYKPLVKGWMDKFATGVDAVMAWTPEASLKAMDEANVERAVLSISSPGTHFGDASQARTVARECNDYAAALGRMHPGLCLVRGAAHARCRRGDQGGRTRAHARRGGGRGLAQQLRRPLPRRAGVPPVVRVARKKRRHRLRPPDRRAMLRRARAGRRHAPDRISRRYRPHDCQPPVVRHFQRLPLAALHLLARRRRAADGSGTGDRHGLRRPGAGRARTGRRGRGPVEALYVDTASVTGAPAMAALRARLPPGHNLYGTDFPWGTLAASRASLARLELAPAELAAIEGGNALRLLAG